MKRKVMQPFRAPRQQNAKSSPTRQSPRRQGKQDQKVQDQKVQVEETAAKTNEAQKDTTDSEDATELGVVWKPMVIKETQYSDFDDITDNGNCEQHGQRFTIEANFERSPLKIHDKPAVASNAASPSCSEFEAFLDKASASAVVPKKISKNDAYWENVLEAEKKRLGFDIGARTISVNDMMVGDDSDDDNVPIVATLQRKDDDVAIVATLQRKQDNLSLLANAATESISSPSLRKKKKPKVSNTNI